MPRYTHDDKCCTFLGDYREYDLYFCPQAGIPTVIARYGNDGPEYLSGMPKPGDLSYRLNDPLFVAMERAMEKGLHHPKKYLVFWVSPTGYGASRIGSVEFTEENLKEAERLMDISLIQEDITGTRHYSCRPHSKKSPSKELLNIQGKLFESFEKPTAVANL